MKFTNSWTGNWNNAFHGLRHPMESYAKSDSDFGIADYSEWLDESASEILSGIEDNEEYDMALDKLYDNGILQWGKNSCEYAFLGPKDIDLAQRMIKAGTPNDKFLRQIFVSVDITAPLYFWKEMDQYKVGTTTNSTSTMHKLASTPITRDCFEMDDFYGRLQLIDPVHWDVRVDELIADLEQLRQLYLQTKDIRYWKELIRWLPEGWLQTRTWTANYSVLRNIIRWRSTHKLTEWHQFVNWCRTLPYSSELLFYNQSFDMK